MTERQHNFEVGDEVYVVPSRDLARATFGRVRLVHKSTSNVRTDITGATYFYQHNGHEIATVGGMLRTVVWRIVHATPEQTKEVDAVKASRAKTVALRRLMDAVWAATQQGDEAAAEVYADVPDTLWALTGHVPDKPKQEGE